MGYAEMVAIAASQSLRARVRLCAVQEIDPGVSADWWVATHIDRLAVTDGWSTAWAAAKGDDPGAVQSVISDAKIRAAVRALVAADTTAEEAKAAAAAQVAADRKAEQEAADEAIRVQQRRDHLWQAHLTARAMAGTLPATVDAVDTPDEPEGDTAQ